MTSVKSGGGKKNELLCNSFVAMQRASVQSSLRCDHSTVGICGEIQCMNAAVYNVV